MKIEQGRNTPDGGDGNIVWMRVILVLLCPRHNRRGGAEQLDPTVTLIFSSQQLLWRIAELALYGS